MTTEQAWVRLTVSIAALRWMIALAIMPSDMRKIASRSLDVYSDAYVRAVREIRAEKRKENAPWN